MRRDYFTLEVSEDDEPPAARIAFEGPDDRFTERLAEDADAVDLAFRLQKSPGAADEGVLAVTDRLTGEFILECNAPVEDVFALVGAARAGDEHRYQFTVSVNGDPTFDSEKSTFLVYDHEGELLRERSLIPSGVEL
ncbi:DUF5793 family protein [Natronomonas sp. EA1]|uniref:DUF5793 family protein n=1 Tax=Natronomonas sp. EA1 TaxID=3421655 RepID=UPI003EBE5A0F